MVWVTQTKEQAMSSHTRLTQMGMSNPDWRGSLLKKTGLDSSLLRKRIAVKGGTTEAGINRLQKNNNMEKIIFNAVNSAFKRSQQIGKKKD